MAVDYTTQGLRNELRGAFALSIVSSAAPAINTDAYSKVDITAQAVTISSFTTNLTGTPNDMDTLTIRLKDNGGAQTITAWGASFEPLGAALPTTTVAGKVTTVSATYDAARSKWGVTSVVTEA